jgi:hypothetical protein
VLYIHRERELHNEVRGMECPSQVTSREAGAMVVNDCYTGPSLPWDCVVSCGLPPNSVLSIGSYTAAKLNKAHHSSVYVSTRAL